jgi:saccharopine dehydrogenase-like NADP-dependent oxidoreductase
MKEIVVLGAGMVGRTLAWDLARDYHVTAVDINVGNLERIASRAVARKTADVGDPASVRSLVSGADLVVSAVPGALGFRVLGAVIEAGKDVVDISFFPEDALELDEAARRRGVTAVVDCGVAPGLSHMILGYHAARSEVLSFKCCVGGLPFERVLPFEYKAPFSPADIIEEYMRPARTVEAGRIVVKPALAEVEPIEHAELGRLEAFCTDGLRTLIRTMKVPNMVEKTIRYPGHAERIQTLKAAGFFDHDPVRVAGQSLRPIDFTSAVLFRSWQLKDEDDEFTLMLISMEALEGGRKTRVDYEIFDRRDRRTGFSSMSRTTAFPATAAARLILSGRFTAQGVIPPEKLGAESDCFNFVIDELKRNGVRIDRTSRPAR